MNKKKVMSTCLAGSMLLGMTAMPAAAVSVDTFTDVNKSDWFYSGVQYVAEKDYMIGVSSNLFAPAMEMTRSMFVTVLARMDGVNGESTKSNFKDVPDDTWYTQAVNWAAANGIVEGNGSDMFLPDSLITRQDMCTMMARYIAYREKKNNVTHVKNGEAKTFLDDSQISDYAVEAVKTCVELGLIQGTDTGYFLPKNNATRAEAATIFSRISFKSNSTSGGSGSTSETKNYTVKATVKLPNGKEAYLDKDYSVTVSGSSVSGDAKFGDVLKALVNDNTTPLGNYINQALSKVYGKTFSQTVDGQLVTVSISAADEESGTPAGVISASMSVKVTDMTGGVQTFALSSTADLEALIGKFQEGGELTFTKAEVVAMDDLLNKIQEVKDLTPDEFNQKVNDIKNDKPELADVVDGMTYDAVMTAADEYQVEVQKVMDKVLADAKVENPADLADDFVSTPIEKAPVVMNVAMDLGAYYQQAVDKYNASKDAYLSRLQTELGKTFTDDQEYKALAVYNQNNPANYVTNNNDKTLSLKSNSAYLTLLQNNVSATADFYASLGEDELFYTGLLERVEAKYSDAYGVTYECTSGNFVESMADLLGDPDGILVDGTTFRDNTSFTITADVNETTYSAWRDLIAGKFSQGSLLPVELPEALNGLFGEYEIEFSITQQ